jgi:hypothetical protein
MCARDRVTALFEQVGAVGGLERSHKLADVFFVSTAVDLDAVEAEAHHGVYVLAGVGGDGELGRHARRAVVQIPVEEGALAVGELDELGEAWEERCVHLERGVRCEGREGRGDSEHQ